MRFKVRFGRPGQLDSPSFDVETKKPFKGSPTKKPRTPRRRGPPQLCRAAAAAPWVEPSAPSRGSPAGSPQQGGPTGGRLRLHRTRSVRRRRSQNLTCTVCSLPRCQVGAIGALLLQLLETNRSWAPPPFCQGIPAPWPCGGTSESRSLVSHGCKMLQDAASAQTKQALSAPSGSQA